MKDPSVPASVAAWRFTLNTGPGSFYGEKYTVEKVRPMVEDTPGILLISGFKAFEDDGSVVSGSTSVVYDSERKILYMHGKWVLLFIPLFR